ncbi:hypothetical protein HK100_007266 [Physocladia obscura]|uniref:BRO1 domain-containing protein n=1 Tax=Physocladia obscura TaxID=109957 RepID=A0AAD5SPR4_9FUNG|nr:hypothetical protein HK100_007266 [Physocladia obscura]
MECYYEKANDDKVSSPSMSIISVHTADYYEIALRYSKEGLNILNRQRFPKNWIQQLTAKTYIYAAIAHLHAPLQLVAEQAVGERIARLSLAKNLATRASNSSKEIGGAVHEVVKGYLDLITSTHLLADAANFDCHQQISVDLSLVTSLRRPSQAFVAPISFHDAIGDLKRFNDMFAAYKLVDQDSDLLKLSTDAVHIIEGATRNLDILRKDIELQISTHAGIQTECLRNILAENKRRGQVVLETIELIQIDEKSEPYKDLMTKLELIHFTINEHHYESTKILDAVQKQPLNTATKHLHQSLCKALHQTTKLLAPRQISLFEIRSIYTSKPVSDFHASEWTTENLTAVIPALDPNRDLAIDDIVSEKKREHAVKELNSALGMLEKLKGDCENKLAEIKNFVESMETLRDSNAIHTQKLRLSLIEESVTQIRNDKDSAIYKIFDAAETVKQISSKRQVEEESRKTIESFEESTKLYKMFKNSANAEITESMKLHKEMSIIFQKCIELKKGLPPGDDNDNIKKFDFEIQDIIKNQLDRLKLLPDYKHTAEFSNNKNENDQGDLTAIQKNQLSSSLLAFSGNSSQDVLYNLLQFQIDRAKATTAEPTAAPSVIDLIKKLLPDGNTSAHEATLSDSKTNELAEVQTAKEIQKFEDMLQSIATVTQQEISRLNKLYAEKERAAQQAAEAEVDRRKEVGNLSGKAWRVLQESSLFGLNVPTPTLPPHFNISQENCPKFPLHRHPHKFYESGNHNLKAPDNYATEKRNHSTPSENNPGHSANPTRVFTSTGNSYELFYDVPFVQSPKESSSGEDELEHVEREAYNIACEAHKNFRRYEEEAKKCALRAQEFQARADEAKKVEEKMKKALELTVDDGSKQHENAPGIVNFIRDEAKFLGNAVWGAVAGQQPNSKAQQQQMTVDEIYRAEAYRKWANQEEIKKQKALAADNARKANINKQNEATGSSTLAFPIKISESFPTEIFPNGSNGKTGNLFNFGNLSKFATNNKTEELDAKIPPMRKQVSLTKPGMVDKCVQEDENTETSIVPAMKRKEDLAKKVKKHDSGIGSMGSEISLSEKERGRKKNGQLFLH